MLVCCFVISVSILLFRKLRTVTRTVVAYLSVILGMWLERYVIVISSASYPRLHSDWDLGTYNPSLVELSIMAAEFAAFILLYIFFTKLFPIVSIWEMKDESDN